MKEKKEKNEKIIVQMVLDKIENVCLLCGVALLELNILHLHYYNSRLMQRLLQPIQFFPRYAITITHRLSFFVTATAVRFFAVVADLELSAIPLSSFMTCCARIADNTREEKAEPDQKRLMWTCIIIDAVE